MHGNNITRFPVPPVRRRNAAVIPIRDVSEVSTTEKDDNLRIVRRDLDHAILKATVVAEYQGELPWLARLLQAALDDVKAKIAESKA